MQTNFYDLRPMCERPEFGPEPSLRQLIEFYCKTHGIPANTSTKALRSQ